MTLFAPCGATGTRRYECQDCLEVIESDDRLDTCPACGGRMHNVSVPRE